MHFILHKSIIILVHRVKPVNEIQVRILTYISNLDKTTDAGNEVDTAVPRIKTLGLTVALVMIITPVVIGSILPPRVVAELELDSVIPPPDTVEEESSRNDTRH